MTTLQPHKRQFDRVSPIEQFDDPFVDIAARAAAGILKERRRANCEYRIVFAFGHSLFVLRPFDSAHGGEQVEPQAQDVVSSPVLSEAEGSNHAIPHCISPTISVP